MVKVRRRVQIFAQRGLCGLKRSRARRALGEDGCGAGAAEGDPACVLIGDGGEADDGVVAMTARELDEHRALGARELRGDQQLAWPDVGLEEGAKELGS